jgi:hypothetical protein
MLTSGWGPVRSVASDLTDVMAGQILDYSPLTAPVSSTEVSAWKAQAKAAGAPWANLSASQVRALIVGSIVGGFLLLWFGNVTFTFSDSAVLTTVAAVLRPVVVIGVFGVAVAVAARWLRNGGPWTRRYRLARFAQANGMAYSPAQGNPDYPGMIFTTGSDRQAIDHLDTTSGRFLDVGNYRWTTGSGRSRSTHTWGFLALSLDRTMPNIVLDSRANNSVLGSNLPMGFDRDQVLHLEGDFDRYFTLYCPKEYEQDALYIFTPDLMSLLIDEAAPFDVELVDRWMFVYSSRPFDMTDPATLQRLFHIADTVGAKTVDQTERYADAGVPDFDADLVRRRGARLKLRPPVVAELAGIVFFVGFIAVWGWNAYGAIFGR